jgi:hypothetical protein
MQMSEGIKKGPSLANVADVVAQSSDNLHAGNVEALGLAAHHRGSSVSATSQVKDQVIRDLRRLISPSSTESADELKDAYAVAICPMMYGSDRSLVTEPTVRSILRSVFCSSFNTAILWIPTRFRHVQQARDV